MKKIDLKILFKKKKKLILTLAVAAMLVIIFLCVYIVYRGYDTKYGDMTAFLTDSMLDAELSYLPNDEKQLEEVANVAASVLDGLVGTSSDRTEMINTVKDAILNLNLGLTDEEATELAEWLVDMYLENYEEVYGDTEQINNSVSAMGDKLLQQMKADLESISKYLSELDSSITNNKEEILNLSLSQSDSYSELQAYLANVESMLNNMKDEFSNYKNEYVNNQALSQSEFSNINSRLDGLQEAVKVTGKNIEDSIKNMDLNNSQRIESVNNMLKNFNTDMAKNLEEINKNISSILEDIKKGNNDNNKVLLEKMELTQEELFAVLTAMEENNVKRQEEAETKNESRYASLVDRLNQVNSNIASTQNDIQSVLADMADTSATRMDVIMEKFFSINTDLGNINTDMDLAHAELSALIETVRTEAGENQTELLATLSGIDASFSEQNTQNFDALVQSLKSQTDNMKTQFDSLNNSFNNSFQLLTENVTSVNEGITNSKTELSQKIEHMNTGINTSFAEITQNISNISQGMSGNQEAVLKRIADMESKTDIKFTNLNNSLQSVFQSVSDGKKLLATALLTKNVTVAENATFSDMQQAILAIPQKIVIGVEQVPGEIEYTYHYHTGDASSGGGCYTIRLYHQHTPGCYTKATCQPFCLGLTHASRNDNWDVHENSRFMHPDCGMGIIYRSPKHFVGDPCNCDHMSSHTYDKLSCGKTNATPEGWAPGCGYVDGQIVEVRIVYNSNAAKKANILQTKEYIPQIYDDYTEVPKESEQESTEVPKESEQESTEVPKESEQESTEVPKESEHESTEVPKESEHESTEVPKAPEQESTEIPKESELEVKPEIFDETN